MKPWTVARVLRPLLTAALLTAFCLPGVGATLPAGRVDPTFGNPVITGTYTGVSAGVMQGDGKTIIGGSFVSVGGAARRGGGAP